MNSFEEYIGIAAISLMGDVPEDLEVVVPSLLPVLEGTVDENTVADAEKVNISVTNLAKDGTAEVQVTPSATIKCKYLGDRTGMSMPNIQIGEQIRVYHFLNTSEYYWAPLGRDDSIRKTEHVKLHVANKKKTKEDLTDDNTYFVELDTREGQRKIHIHTSSGTDEEVTYDILIDTDKSEVSILDSKGNGWHLKSKDFWIKVFNNNGCFHEIDKDNIHHHAVDTYKVTCKHYVRESEDDDTITTKKTTRESTDTIDTHTAENTLVADTKDTTETAEQVVTASTKIDHTTPLETHTVTAELITGNLGIGGFIGGGGGSGVAAPTENKIEGDLSLASGNGGDGTLTAETDVKAGTPEVSLVNHEHPGDGADNTGSVTTGPPIT